MVTTGMPALDKTLIEGYPAKSAILVEAPSGNNRDLLIYKFIQAGLNEGNFCAYVTRLPPAEVTHDARGFEVDLNRPGLIWMSPEGGERNYSMNDLATISFGIKELLRGRGEGTSRVAFDGLSQLLMLHSQDSVYRFVSQLLPELKKQDAVILATVQEDMHQPQVLSAMELLFDGVVKVSRTEEGEMAMRVKKMRGVDLSVQPALQRSGGPAGRPRLAVLPFASISPDPADEYLSDGLTEELISTLSKLEGVDVIARTSVMRYKGSAKPVSEVCRELRAGTILEGSTRRSGKKLRVTVQMIDGEQDRHLWAESYDRELEDIFAIQTDIARMVAEQVSQKFQTGLGEGGPPSSGNPIGYDYYLKGRHLLGSGPKGPEEAARYFRLAIESDPRFARAYSGLSDYYSFVADDTMPSGIACPKAKEFAQKALSLDPNLSDDHVSLALIASQYDWDWPAAEGHFLDSVRLNKNNAFAFHWYGLFLKSMGNFDKGLELVERAKELDPFSDTTRFAAAVLRWCKGEDALATAECRKAMELNPRNAGAHIFLALSQLRHGDRESAVLEAREADGAEADRGVRGLTGYLLGKLGKLSDAERILAQLRGEANPNHFAIALVLLGLGERGEASEEFRRAAELRSSYFPMFARNPMFEEILGDPSYVEFLSKARLDS